MMQEFGVTGGPIYVVRHYRMVHHLVVTNVRNTAEKKARCGLSTTSFSHCPLERTAKAVTMTHA